MVTDDEGLEGTFSTTVEVQPAEKEEEEEGVFIPGFSIEMGLLSTLALLGWRKRRWI